MSTTNETKHRTAVLMSGHMRTFKRCFPTQHWHVFRKFANVDFFVSTVRDADGDPEEIKRTIRQYYPEALIVVDAVDAQPELPIPVPPLDPTWTVGRMYSHEPYGISVHPQAILRQLWQLEQCWRLFSQSKLHTYDCIVRIRPDLWFRNFVMPPWQNGREIHTPYWGRFGGVNDRFAVMPVNFSSAYDSYFGAYTWMKQLLAMGCPLHPESLIKASVLSAGGIINDRMICEFSKLYGPENAKLNGTFRDPEVTSADLANLMAHR